MIPEMMRSGPVLATQPTMLRTSTKLVITFLSGGCSKGRSRRYATAMTCLCTNCHARRTICEVHMYTLYMEQLDDLDRRLLAALREDGRAPVAELARRLGVARATVNGRIDRLVASGTIIGFSVRVRDEADPLTIHAISFIEVEGRSTDDVIRGLRGFPEVIALHTTNGGWDLVAELRTETLGEFDRVLGRIRSIDGVVNSETSLLLSSVLR